MCAIGRSGRPRANAVRWLALTEKVSTVDNLRRNGYREYIQYLLHMPGEEDY